MNSWHLTIDSVHTTHYFLPSWKVVRATDKSTSPPSFQGRPYIFCYCITAVTLSIQIWGRVKKVSELFACVYFLELPLFFAKFESAIKWKMASRSSFGQLRAFKIMFSTYEITFLSRLFKTTKNPKFLVSRRKKSPGIFPLTLAMICFDCFLPGLWQWSLSMKSSG